MQRSSRHNPCPLCDDHRGKCAVTNDGAVFCLHSENDDIPGYRRVAAVSIGGAKYVPTDDGEGYRFRFGARHRNDFPPARSGRLHVIRPGSARESENYRDLSAEVEQYQIALGEARMKEWDTAGEVGGAGGAGGAGDLLTRLADDVGLPVASLYAVGVGYFEKYSRFTFPEYDAKGAVIGISTRSRGRGANKRFMPGGHRGLSLTINDAQALREARKGSESSEYTSTSPGAAKPCLVVEGASDVAAAHAVGLSAIGRPSNVSTQYLADALRALGIPPESVIVVGENDQKQDKIDAGETAKRKYHPGGYGADVVSQHLANALRAPIRVAYPPKDIKDLRQWVIALAKRGVTGDEARSAIISAWAGGEGKAEGEAEGTTQSGTQSGTEPNPNPNPETSCAHPDLLQILAEGEGEGEASTREAERIRALEEQMRREIPAPARYDGHVWDIRKTVYTIDPKRGAAVWSCCNPDSGIKHRIADRATGDEKKVYHKCHNPLACNICADLAGRIRGAEAKSIAANIASRTRGGAETGIWIVTSVIHATIPESLRFALRARNRWVSRVLQRAARATNLPAEAWAHVLRTHTAQIDKDTEHVAVHVTTLIILPTTLRVAEFVQLVRDALDKAAAEAAAESTNPYSHSRAGGAEIGGLYYVGHGETDAFTAATRLTSVPAPYASDREAMAIAMRAFDGVAKWSPSRTRNVGWTALRDQKEPSGTLIGPEIDEKAVVDAAERGGKNDLFSAFCGVTIAQDKILSEQTNLEITSTDPARRAVLESLSRSERYDYLIALARAVEAMVVHPYPKIALKGIASLREAMDEVLENLELRGGNERDVSKFSKQKQVGMITNLDPAGKPPGNPAGKPGGAGQNTQASPSARAHGSHRPPEFLSPNPDSNPDSNPNQARRLP